MERYFIRDDSTYHVRKDIRDMAIFAVQNVIKDPPFTKLDLISCRNVLVYLDLSLQKRLLPIFHYALKPGGFLFLGPSETIGGFTDLFEVVDNKWKIFRRKETVLASHPLIGIPSQPLRVESLRQAVVHNTEITHEDVCVRANGDYVRVTLRVTRINEPETVRGSGRNHQQNGVCVYRQGGPRVEWTFHFAAAY